MNRDELRTKIFSTKVLKTEMISLFGVGVEIRQPTLGDIIKMQGMEDRAQGIVYLLISYCFVPGTNDKIFEPADEKTLLGLPFDESFTSASLAITRMIGVDVEEEVGN